MRGFGLTPGSGGQRAARGAEWKELVAMISSREDPSSQDLGARLEMLGRSLGEREGARASNPVAARARAGGLREAAEAALAHFLEEATAS